MTRFSLDAAREQTAFVRRRVEALRPVRAELASLMEAHAREEAPLAEVKGAEARLSELLDQIRAEGIQVKGYAPVLVDFVWEDDPDVLLCYLEGEEDLRWWHHVNHGFMGRRPIEELGD